MGAKDTMTPEVEARMTKQRLLDITTHECADAIDIRLRTVTPAWLQAEYGLSAVEAESVHKAIRRMREHVDPIGDWR